MLCYKTIPWDTQAISSQLAQQAAALGYLDREIAYRVNHLDPKHLLDTCPAFAEFFKLQGFTVRSASFYIAEFGDPSDIHIDHGVRAARISLPVLNCQYSRTVFYRVDPQKIKYTLLANGTRYSRCPDPDAEEIASVSIVQPTVLNSRIPHDIIVTRENVRRIAITVAVDPDPVFLLKE